MYGIASLLVVFREVLHAATVLIFEIIAWALTMAMNGPTVVCGINSLLAVIQEAIHATRLVSEIIARAPMMRRMM